MSHHELLESITRAAVLASQGDQQALTDLRDLLGRFVESGLCQEHECIRHAAALALEEVDAAMPRAGGDGEDLALDKVFRAIDDMLEAAEAVELGGAAAGPADEIDHELLETWIESSAGALSELEAALLQIESGDSADSASEARRIIHTIKGECGVVSAHGLQRLFHEAESAIDRRDECGAAFPVDHLLELIDWVRGVLCSGDATAIACAEADPALLARLERSGVAKDTADNQPGSQGCIDQGKDMTEPVSGSGDLVIVSAEMDDMLREFISESREHFVESERALLELESSPDDKELINTVFRAFHTIKGVAGFLNLEPIVTLAHKAEFVLDGARNDTVPVDSDLLDLALGACDLLSTLINSLDGGAAPSQADYDAMIRALEAALEGEVRRPRQDAVQAEEKPATAETPSASAASPATSEQPPKAASPARSGKRQVEQTIKVNTMRLDSLVDMVGELVIGHQMVVQDPEVSGLTEQRTQRNLVHVGKIIRDLQEVAMSLRMVTLRGPFQKMARLVRDLSSKAGKKINLRIEGEDTELDRNVVDEIGDPLVHMIRNACDHGIEPPDERIAAGKSPEGTLTLRAFHKGGAIVIEVEDDGRGLHRDKILRKAMERGIVPADRDPGEMPDSEVYQLLFAPGFSTAEKVTDVSGRGVGMDVVKRNIEALRGKTEIRSTPGKGSTFVLSLPLTMAIIDGMIVRVGSQRYVIPTLSIERSFQPRPEEVHTIMGAGEAVLVREDLLPIYRLSDLFDLEEGNRDISETLLVVVESNTSRGCLQVDELLGQQQVVIKSLGEGIGRVRGVSGGAILGDGLVAPILDVAGLFAQASELGSSTTTPPLQGAA